MSHTPLKDSLETFSAQMAEMAPPEALEAIGQGIGGLVQSGQADRAISRGSRAPMFELPDADGNTVALADLLTAGPVVLSFNRGNWCPFCNLEFKALNDAVTDIEGSNATLLVVTPQKPEKTRIAASENGYRFRTLYDSGNRVATRFGLTFEMPQTLQPIHEAFEMNVPEWNGDGSWNLPFPATYVIDQSGLITYAYVDANWMNRAEPADVVAALKQAH